MEKPPQIGSAVAVVAPGGGRMVTGTVLRVRFIEGRTFVLVRIEPDKDGGAVEYPLSAIAPLS